MTTTVLRTVGRNLTIRKNGARGHAWRVSCSECSRRKTLTYFTSSGAVVVNDQGIGNRTHALAVQAANAHLRAHADGRLS